MENKQYLGTPLFNMAIATLERIDDILRDLNENWKYARLLLIQRNLICLYKELNPFLNKNEKNIGDEKYLSIVNGKKLDEYKSTYKEDRYKELDKFDFWIRNKLYEKDLLMAQKGGGGSGLDSIKKRYGI